MINWLCSRETPNTDYFVDVSPPPSRATSSSILTLTCYEDQALKVAIPSTIIWTRVLHGWSTQVQEHGHAYICTPTDIGSIIQAQVTAKHPNSTEKKSSTIKFGPITLDAEVRPELDLLMRNCLASFVVTITVGSRSKQYVLHISDSDIEIKDPRTGNNIKSTYTAIEPQLIESRSDGLVTSLLIPKENEEDYSRYFDMTLSPSNSLIKIRFDSRTLRDSFILARRAFVVKRELRLMNIIHNSLESNISNSNSVDLLLEMASVKSFNQFLIKKKDMYKDEVRVLQEEIENVRGVYNRIIEYKLDRKVETVFQTQNTIPNLLDSSFNSKMQQTCIKSEYLDGVEPSYKFPRLPTIGEVSDIKYPIKNGQDEFLYSQVYPVNSKILRGLSVKEQSVISDPPQFQTIVEGEVSDQQSILDSNNVSVSRQREQYSQSILNTRREDTEVDLTFERNRNNVLESKIAELQEELRNSKSHYQHSERENQTHLEAKEKETLIELLNAENATLKLQLSNSNIIKDAYKSRCEELKSLIVIIPEGEAEMVESQFKFSQSIKHNLHESQKLMRESKRLNSLCREAISSQILHSNISHVSHVNHVEE